uniref:NADH dehydrogenase subunit 4L n=1 Tax=Planorbella pilsbryi TaxID=2823525 RepID=A0A8E8PDL3_9GAST|nr:NADH dehydrogenase subunit 4L [Planorbella pilsbryi]
MFLCCCIFFICFLLYSYIFNKMFILNALVVLESIMLISMIFMLFSLNMMLETKYMFLMVLTFAACEAAIGLSLLVSFIRLRGNNYMLSLFFAKNTWNFKFT